MKIWKRRMALVLALVLLLSTGAMAAGAKYSSWFAPYYKEMQALGILPASFTTGDLTATITRGEMSELAVVAFEKATGNIIDELERTDYFTDTTDKNILKAHEYGIVSGYPDGTFQPDKTLTRQEFFKIIQNFCEAAAYTSTRSKDLGSFADSGSIGAWAREAAQLCVSNSFVDGTKSGSATYLRPTEGASRQEAMVMFLRAYKDVRQWYNVNITTASVEVNESDLNVTVTDVSKTMYVATDTLNVRDSWLASSTKVGTLKRNRPHRLRLRPVSFERSGRLGFRLRLDRRNSQRQRRSDRYRELRHELRRLLVRLGWHIAFDRLRLLGPHVLRPDAVRLQHEARGKRPDDARHSCLER